MAEQPKLGMSDKKVRTVTGWTILFMVLLRVAIGWHFFYEGVWKLKQDDWRATSYLVMSMGPLRDVFRMMVPDVDGLEQLTPEGSAKVFEKRCAQLIKHYGIKDEALLKQLEAFKKLRLGPAEDDAAYRGFVQEESTKLVDKIYADFAGRLASNAASQPAPAFAEAEVKAELGRAMAAAVPGFNTDAGKTASPELTVAVNAFLKDPAYKDRVALAQQKFSNELRNHGRRGRMSYVKSIFADPDFARQIHDYTVMAGSKTGGEDIEGEVHEFEKRLGTTAYNKERLLDQYLRKAKAKAACIAIAEKPLRDLDLFVVGDVGQGIAGLIPQAYLSATAAKDPKADTVYHPMMAKGLPHYPSPTRFIDWANMISLTAVGVGLILGLFTRLSAVGGIGLLMMYYWCMPSLPWLPEAGPMEGHYFFVNKNIIEALALAAIATSGIGRWAGLDAFLFRKRRLAGA